MTQKILNDFEFWKWISIFRIPREVKNYQRNYLMTHIFLIVLVLSKSCQIFQNQRALRSYFFLEKFSKKISS